LRTAVNIVHVLVTVFLFSSEVHAVDGLAIEIGTGDEDATRGGAAVQWGWERELLSVGDWFLGGYWEFGFSYWDGDSGRTGTGSLGEVGFAPVFRIEPRTPIVGWVTGTSILLSPSVTTLALDCVWAPRESSKSAIAINTCPTCRSGTPTPALTFTSSGLDITSK